MTEQKNALPSMNEFRIHWAQLAITAFVAEVETDFEDRLCDLLCNLMHWAGHNGLDFNAELTRASAHCEAEILGLD